MKILIFLQWQKHLQECDSHQQANNRKERDINYTSTTDCSLLLYYTSVSPKYEYASFVWSNVMSQSSSVTVMDLPRVFQEFKIPRLHYNGTGWL